MAFSGTTRPARAIAAAALASALVLSGCSASPESAAIEACSSEAGSLRASETHKSSSLSEMHAWAHPDGGAAWYVSGKTRFKMPDGSTEVQRWKCFTQTSDGKTYSAILG